MAGSTRTPTTALGHALKAAREEVGVTQRKLAELMGRKTSSSGLIARWETGERTPKPEDVAEVIEALGLEGAAANELMALANGAGRSQWLAVTLPERRQQVAALLAAERTATVVTQLSPLLIPGVLQTYDVIRAIMISGGVPEDEVDQRVTERIGRRHLITRKNPAQLNVLLGESAIHQVIGSREIMADQMRHLLESMGQSNVDIRLVSNSAGWTPLLTGPFILIDSDEVPPIVSLEMHRSGLMMQAPQYIADHRRAADDVREKAMTSEATAEIIADRLTELEKAE
ncbi:helix-turn-helix transcriptional regulator [Amycolatopsis minnesotensis]|uniref:Helix-turn-helix transcriptional regulator n=1 Tax=Amycolatopsis minnesotensis TaxID=337894 RepID=A0ABN2Q6C8_9PSEU